MQNQKSTLFSETLLIRRGNISGSELEQQFLTEITRNLKYLINGQMLIQLVVSF